MILTKTIEVRPNSKTLSFYKKLGYECDLFTRITIPVTHLTKGSHQIIDVKCDFCGCEKKLDYNSYWRNTKQLSLLYSCSEKCGLKKREATVLNKYGVKNVFENKEIKEKIKQSYIKNLGVDHPSKSVEIQNNTKLTNLKRYGFTCSLLNKEIKEKCEKIHLEKNGVKNPFQNGKSQITKKNKIVEKYKDVGLIDIKDKKYILKCDKGHLVELEKSIFHNRIISKTILCNECNPVGDFHRSGSEIELGDYITENYMGIIEINKKINYKELDIYLPDLNLAFEFNGIYWHNEYRKTKNYHLNKTKLCEKLGIKLIHIYEDDWKLKKNSIKHRILNLLKNINPKTINDLENDTIYKITKLKNKILCEVNRSWSNGKELEMIGFVKTGKTNPNYSKRQINNTAFGVYDSGSLLYEMLLNANSSPNNINSR